MDKKVLNCQNPDIRTNNPYCNVLLWVMFDSILKVNQQKRVGMIFTNNI